LQTSNTNKFQSTAKINFSPLGKLHVTKKLEAMDAVRMALIELKAEGFRSCGKDLDRRAQGDFVFSKPAGVERDDLKETKASAWVRRMCQDMGHLVLRDWGRFDYTKENSYVHERHVRFLHPASEQFIDEKHQTWVFEGYDVHFVPTQDVLIPTNPCSIAIHGAGAWSKDDIEEELSTGLRISMLKKGPRRHFSTTAIMSTRNGSWLLRRTSASQSTSVNRCQSISHPGNSCTTSTPKQRRSIKLWLQRIVGGTDEEQQAERRDTRQEQVGAEVITRMQRLEEIQATVLIYQTKREAQANLHRLVTWNTETNSQRDARSDARMGLMYYRNKFDIASTSREKARRDIAIWGSMDSDIGRALLADAQGSAAQAEEDMRLWTSQAEMAQAAVKTIDDSAVPVPEITQCSTPPPDFQRSASGSL